MNDFLFQAHAIATEPLTLAALSFLFALFALLLAFITPGKIRRLHDIAVDFRRKQLTELGKLGGKMAEYEGFAVIRARTAVQQTVEVSEEAPPQPSAAVESGLPEAASKPQELTPLEKTRAGITEFLGDLLSSFEDWAKLAGFDLDAAVDVRTKIAGLRQMVQPPADEEAIGVAVNERLPSLITETVKVLVSRTDRDCDPERENTRLQQHIELFLQKPRLGKRLTLIDPKKGDRIDLQEHKTLRLVTGTPQERGSVSGTKVRGLRWNDQVVLKAEVLEYD